MAVCGKCIHKNVCEFCKEMGFQNVVRANDFNCKDYLPEADVVEVVRCRNCANFKEIIKAKAGICYHRNSNGIRGITDFCSYGVKKEGADVCKT